MSGGASEPSQESGAGVSGTSALASSASGKAVEPLEAEHQQAEAQAAGRGGVAVLGAKVFFILSGLIQQTLLPLAITLPGYGALSRVLAASSVVTNVMVTSSIQSVSRTVASSGENEAVAYRRALRLHAPIALALGLIFVLAAPAIAAFQHAPHITNPLRIMGVVVALYGMYAPMIGALNGRRRFTRQAMLDVIYAILRTAGLLLGGYWLVRAGESGALGSSLGFALAVIVIIPIAIGQAGLGKSASHSGSNALVQTGPYLVQVAGLATAQLSMNLLMQSDITLLGRFLSLSAPGAVDVGVDPVKSADGWVAVYRACQLFAFLPFQLTMSVAQILFPMVAKAHAEGDRERVGEITARGARIAALLCGLVVVVTAAIPQSMIAFAYGPEVGARGASTLRVLAIGQGAFTLFAIGTTVLASLGREKLAAALGAVATVFVAAACWMLARTAAFGEAQLEATALATTIALVLAFGVAAMAAKRHASRFLPPLSAIRIALVVGVIIWLGERIPATGRLLTPLVALAIGAVYLVALVVTGELKKADAEAIVAIARRRRKNA